jgi:8-oxo-dGTP pyrophosphatase MutT (NUDIX family)
LSFDLPREVVLPVDVVDVRLDPGPHPFELANREAIAANWIEEKAAKPALFDGRIALLSELAYRSGGLVGRCHEVGYSTFLYWRRTLSPEAGHTFAHPVLVSSDDALIAIRMGAHTVNAGAVYFPAGSFEPEDFSGGLVDVDANIVREVREETGLDIAEAPRDRRWHVLAGQRGTVIFRRYRLGLDADTVAARIRAFVAADADPEIEGPVVIRRGEAPPPGLRAHMPALIDWHFSGAE